MNNFKYIKSCYNKYGDLLEGFIYIILEHEEMLQSMGYWAKGKSWTPIEIIDAVNLCHNFESMMRD